nr:tektin a1 [Hymenolepis microstoma]
MSNSCEDNIPQNPVQAIEPSSFPEQAYTASNGYETGIPIMGFRSGRYVPVEARRNLQNRLLLVEKDVEISQKFRENTVDLICSTLEKTKYNFTNTTESFRSRLQDIHHWARELENEIYRSVTITDFLIRRFGELETSLKALDECLLLTTDCINARQRRFGEDLQQDTVEIQLLRELDMINKHIAFTKEAITSINEQVKKNREAKANMEKAWSDKHEADLLDSEAAHLSITSGNTQYYPGEARAWPQAAQSTPISWMQHAQDLILVSEEQRRASCYLSDLVEKLLISTEKTIIAQKDRVNVVLLKRLEEYEFEKQELINKLGRLSKEILKVEESIEELKRAKAAKDAYVKVVQTRLHLHNQRKNVESCRDPPQQLMLNELHDLNEIIDQLENQIQSSIEKLKHLQDEQLILERQIHMKNASIQVDRDHCVGHRERFPSPHRLRGH